MPKKCVAALAFVIALYCALPCCFGANAQEYTWARITKEGVNLYADEACDKTMFLLEKSYYVEILATLDNTYQVAVMGNSSVFPSVLGYVRKIEATPVEVTPLSPVYPTEQIYVTTDSAQLKLLPVPSSEIVIVATTTQKLNYYGKLTYYGKDWYYVYFGGKFGYVEAENVSAPAIQLHPTPLDTGKPVVKPQPPDDNTPNDNETKSKTPTAEILLIVFVVLLAGGLTLALFLPGNGKKVDVFEDDI